MVVVPQTRTGTHGFKAMRRGMLGRDIARDVIRFADIAEKRKRLHKERRAKMEAMPVLAVGDVVLIKSQSPRIHATITKRTGSVTYLVNRNMSELWRDELALICSGTGKAALKEFDFETSTSFVHTHFTDKLFARFDTICNQRCERRLEPKAARLAAAWRRLDHSALPMAA